MKTRRFVVLLILVCLASAPAFAGNSLSIRLVHATAQQADARGLEDVVSVLKRSLPYGYFRLTSSTSMPLPADTSRSMDGYTVNCKGAQTALRITVTKGNRSLVNTTVSLRNGKPVILGGLPASEGKLILVFVAR